MSRPEFIPPEGLALWLPLPTEQSHAFLRLACEHSVRIGWLSLTVPEGFGTDGASIPGFVAWIFPLHTRNLIHRAGVFHDYAYRTQCCGRWQADAMFRTIMHADGVPSWAAFCCFWAVRIFGGRYWKRSTKRVHEARRELSFDDTCEGLQPDEQA